MLYDTLDEYEEAITEQKALIKRLRLIGQQHANNSGGTSRDTTEVDIESATKHLASLQREKKVLNGDTNSVFIAGFGW